VDIDPVHRDRSALEGGKLRRHNLSLSAIPASRPLRKQSSRTANVAQSEVDDVSGIDELSLWRLLPEKRTHL
jgi:hypothetical protein